MYTKQQLGPYNYATLKSITNTGSETNSSL